MQTLYPIKLIMRDELEKIFKAENSDSADFCFGNIYMWDCLFRQSVAFSGDRLITKLVRRGEVYFAFPVGSGDIRPAVDTMLRMCSEDGTQLKLCGIEERHKALLESEYPGKFQFSDDRDFSDYLYDIDRLCSYSGKHLHGKKNFCNRFEDRFRDNWRFEPISEASIGACRDFLGTWLDFHGDSAGLKFECDALYRAFESYGFLGLSGGMLFAEDRLIGFSIGEKISDNCFCVHFEKALGDVDGAYPMLCREMAKTVKRLYPDIHYVNREDDMGNLSLRKSKLSYHPEIILNKYTAKVKA